MTVFSQEQLRMFDAYERIRKSGRWNMFDPRARHASGLSEDDYSFVITNYEALYAQRHDQSDQP